MNTEEHRYVLALDIHPERIEFACMREDGKVIHHKKVVLSNNGEKLLPEWGGGDDTSKVVEKFLKKLKEELESFMDSLKKHHPKIAFEALGISTVGPLSQNSTAIAKNSNMPYPLNTVELPIVEVLRHENCPVYMINDCNAGVVGEYHYGVASDFSKEDMDSKDRLKPKPINKYHTIVYLTLSTGIGAGILFQGRLLSGTSGNAGEIGHLTVETEYKLECNCNNPSCENLPTGNTSCQCTLAENFDHWEAYCGGGRGIIFEIDNNKSITYRDNGFGVPVFFRAYVEKKYSKEMWDKILYHYKTTLCNIDKISESEKILNTLTILKIIDYYQGDKYNENDSTIRSIYLDFFKELVRIHRRGLFSVIVAYNPDMIILDGYQIQRVSCLYEELRKREKLQPDGYMVKDCKYILKTTLGGFASIHGAAAYTFDHLF